MAGIAYVVLGIITIMSDAYGLSLRRAELDKAELSRYNLSRADLVGAHLKGANLEKADLRFADIRSAHMQNAILIKANLREADLREAKLIETNLQKTILNEAIFHQADLKGADLQEANLLFADFRTAQNLKIQQVEKAQKKDKAFYDNTLRKELGITDKKLRELIEEYAQYMGDNYSEESTKAIGPNLLEYYGLAPQSKK